MQIRMNPILVTDEDLLDMEVKSPVSTTIQDEMDEK